MVVLVEDCNLAEVLNIANRYEIGASIIGHTIEKKNIMFILTKKTGFFACKYSKTTF
ncbi:MAG: hypothetical protein L6V95_03160 [Candidatus Melainabacteria bacterium]|nr:MAG: hypothetical protein L6V95_03160 [Candidatus Melainabacteria bacterium]